MDYKSELEREIKSRNEFMKGVEKVKEEIGEKLEGLK